MKPSIARQIDELMDRRAGQRARSGWVEKDEAVIAMKAEKAENKPDEFDLDDSDDDHAGER